MAGSIFGGIDKAQVYGSGNFLKPGKYKVDVAALKTVESTQIAGRVYFVVEGKITAILAGGEGMSVGEDCTWLVDMTKPSALSNVKGFALALVPGATEDDITEDQMLALVSEDNPAAGLSVKVSVFQVKTRKGTDFSKHLWFPVESNDPEDGKEVQRARQTIANIG